MKRFLSLLLILAIMTVNLAAIPSNAYAAPSPARTGTYGQYYIDTTADRVTDPPIGGEDGFGTQASAGRIWTDKSLIHGESGSFAVTLSALAQEYTTTSSNTNPGLGGAGSGGLAADVTFILDMSTSMRDNQDVAKGNGLSGNYKRIEAMVLAANEAIQIVMNANPKNRVAVHWYGNTANNIHVGTLMELGSYTLPENQGGKFLDLNTSGNMSLKGNTQLRKDNAEYVSQSVTPGAGTPTQDGVLYGMTKAIQSLASSSENDSKRKPYVFILSDGAAVHGRKDWYGNPAAKPVQPNNYNRGTNADNLPVNNSATRADHNTGTAEIAAVTILTARHMREQLESAYQQYNGDSTTTAKVYTVGLGSDIAINGPYVSNKVSNPVYAWAGLDPKTVDTYKSDTTFRNGSAKATHDQIVAYATGDYTSYANDYVYSDYYKFASTYPVLEEAFEELSKDVEVATTILPLLHLPINSQLGGESEKADIASAISIVDEIGDGFSIDLSTLKIGTSVATVDSSIPIQDGVVYQFDGYKSSVVVKTIAGVTKLTWYIDADDMQSHIYRYTNRSKPVEGQYTAPVGGPFQVTYKLAPSFTETPDTITSYEYYANAFTPEEGAKAVAYFNPPDDSPYYKTLVPGKESSKSNIDNLDLGVQYISKENRLENKSMAVQLGNNGRLNLLYGIHKKGTPKVVVDETITYTVTIYNYTDKTESGLTVESDGEVQSNVTFQAEDKTELTFTKKAPSTATTVYSDQATVTEWGILSNTVATQVVALPEYTVTFHPNRTGIVIPSETVKKGKLVTEPSIATQTAANFLGWCLDTELTVSWNFEEDVVTSDMDLYGQWNNHPTVDNGTIVCPYETEKSITIVGSDPDNDTLTYTLETQASNGTVTDNGKGSFTYDPKDKYSGTDTFTVKVSDGRGGEAISTITVTVAEPINNPPTVGNYNINCAYESEVGVTVVATDIDGDTLTYTIGTDASNGTVTDNGNGSFTYKANEEYSGADTFTVKVSDGKGGEATSTVTVTVAEAEPINNPPTVGNYNINCAYESEIGVTVVATDVDGDTLTYTIATGSSHGSLINNGFGSFTYTAQGGYSGTDTFTVRVSDGLGGEAISTVTVTVAEPDPINNPPTVGNYNINCAYESEVSVTVVGSDLDNDTLTYTVGTQASNGTVTDNGNGSFTYKANDEYSGTDTFTVKVSDGRGGEVFSTITVTVAEPKATEPKEPSPIPSYVPLYNNVPTIGDYEARTDYQTPVSGIVIGHDIDRDTLTYGSGRRPSHGLVTVSWNGSWTYVPDEGFSGSDSFTIIVIDGWGAQAESTIRIIVMKDIKIQMEATPDTLVADGKSTSRLTAKVIDKNDNPVEGVTVVFSAEVGSFPYGNTAVTAKDGVATVTFQSDKVESVNSHRIPVTATVDDREKDLFAQDQINITFEPASIHGTVVDNSTGRPVVGATITVQKDFNGDGVIDFYATATTSVDGHYNIPVPKGDTSYEVLITTSMDINGRKEAVTFVQNSIAGNITGKESELFDAVKTAAGLILLTNPDGSTTFLDDYSRYSIALLQDNDGEREVIHNSNGVIHLSGNSKGTFRVEDLEKGKAYTLQLMYQFDNGDKIIVGSVEVSLNEDGQINLGSILIDPYGDITDSVTGELLEGVKVVLYYADTARNASAGRKAGDLVDLPLVGDFPPADNENPHFSDSHGKYAWMVFPEADYYIVATKDGYEEFISETIGVDHEIVRYDFQMNKIEHSNPVIDNKEGNATDETEDENELSITEDKDKINDMNRTKIPKTGESINLVLYGLLSVVFAFAMLYNRKKRVAR